MVDRCLATANADLASRATLVDGLDARLVLINPTENVDKYYILQGLEDPSEDGDSRFYSLQSWGRTGTRGDCKITGPTDKDSVVQTLAKIFREKTGSDWGSLQAGDRVPDGKYWLQRHSAPDQKACWEYYVGDGVDGKRPGWYPYEDDASEEVEMIFAQHEANEREDRTASRVISSGYFSYRVDLSNMKQENTRTGKVRDIRRVFKSSGLGAALKPVRAAMKAMKKRVLKAVTVKKVAMKKPMKAKPKKVKKAMKKPKKKAASIIAKGKRARASVFAGKKQRTKTGLKKADLKKNKDGKIVTKKKSALGKKQFKNVAKWIGACKQARDQLGITGFAAVKKGTPLYNLAKELYPDAKPWVLRQASSESLA